MQREMTVRAGDDTGWLFTAALPLPATLFPSCAELNPLMLPPNTF